MPIYEITENQLSALERTSFAKANIRERNDLQRQLKTQIDIVADDILIIAEEFGDWDESRRRIDLLGIDKIGNIVVIELKRTEDGGHMELQAIRYAAMVSALTFDEAVEIYSKFLIDNERDEDARENILSFLDLEEPDEDSFAQDVRIILVSAKFSKEITTSVLWLNERGLDVRCVRLIPYKDGDRTLLDVQQVIPLPEAEEYQIKIQRKSKLERESRTSKKDYTKFDITLGAETLPALPKNRALFNVVRYLCKQGANPEKVREILSFRKDAFRDVEGVLDAESIKEALAQKLKDMGMKPIINAYFIEEGELIHANGKTYTFNKRWGPKTEGGIKSLIDAFPDFGVSYKISDV